MPTRRRVLKLHPEARAEMKTSVSFYRQRGGDRLAQRFKEHIKAGFKAILAGPDRFPPVPSIPGVQKFRLKHFPFAILYVSRPYYILIVSEAHGRRSAGYRLHRVILARTDVRPAGCA